MKLHLHIVLDLPGREWTQEECDSICGLIGKTVRISQEEYPKEQSPICIFPTVTDVEFM